MNQILMMWFPYQTKHVILIKSHQQAYHYKLHQINSSEIRCQNSAANKISCSFISKEKQDNSYFFLVNQIYPYKQIYQHTPFILFCWTLTFASTSNFTNSCNYAIVSILHITLSSSCSRWFKVIYLINNFDWYKSLKPSLLCIWWNYNLYNNIISRFTLN